MSFLIHNIILQKSVLLGILIIAAVWDIKYKKIPNSLILTGFVFGFLCMSSWKSIITGIVFLIILFLFSNLHMIGNGDIKLWMVISLFAGPITSCMIMLIAVGLFILYGLIRYKVQAINAYKTSLLFTITRKTAKGYTGTAIPFAPFMLGGYLLYLLIMLFI